MKKNQLPLFYWMVFASGFSGLVYEVTWQRYLGVLLGSQAWATALVLSVYLGGLSVGYFLFGFLSRRYLKHGVGLYGLVEIGIAVWAFLFPTLFSAFFNLVPKWQMTMGATSVWIDLFSSISLLAIPTILMGATLPLLSQSLSTSVSDSSPIHARLYGFNTLGACVGCLAAGYWLIPAYGLAWSTYLSGVVNLFVGAGAVWLGRPIDLKFRKAAAKSSRSALSREDKILVGIGFLSGFYLITLQSVFIRLLGLSAGSSNYNFALVVSIFIFCLALGSLAARHIASYKPERLFWNQLYAATTLFCLYLTCDSWSYWAHLLRVPLRDMPELFLAYQAMLGAGMLSLLIIPLGLTGLTLPLCFHLMKKQSDGLGDRVGWLYGFNTVGCIAGALFGGFWLLEYLDIDQIFKVSIFLVLATVVAAGVLTEAWKHPSRTRVSFAASLMVVSVVGTTFAPLFHKDRFIQPFRHPRPMEATFRGPEAFGAHLGRATKLLSWKDGPNTSIGIGASFYNGKEISRTILVNGKSDGNTRGDLLTTIMLAHIPGLLGENPARACVIGFGTGMTVGSLLHYPQVQAVDVVEISGTLIRRAGQFDAFNGAVSRSPKVRFHEMDAMRYLGATSAPYDVVISEPSNPWVSGVENLFSLEFYQRAQRALSATGLFVQWIHAYSFTEDLFRTTVGTMGKVFPYVTVFQLKGGDYALVGAYYPFGQPEVERGAKRYGELKTVREDLALAGIPSFEVFLGLELMGPATVRQVANATEEMHTLIRPRLSDAAARAFFVGYAADIDEFRRRYKTYYRDLHRSLFRVSLQGRKPSLTLIGQMEKSYCSNDVKADFLCREALSMRQLDGTPGPIMNPEAVAQHSRSLASLSPLLAPVPKSDGNRQLQQAYERFETFKRLASPVFFVDYARLMAPVDACLSSTSRKSDIWGQCQLQRILVLEWLKNPSPELGKARKDYLMWFETLPKTNPNFERLKEAKRIIEKM